MPRSKNWNRSKNETLLFSIVYKKFLANKFCGSHSSDSVELNLRLNYIPYMTHKGVSLTGLTVTFPAVSSEPASFENTHLNVPICSISQLKNQKIVLMVHIDTIHIHLRFIINIQAILAFLITLLWITLHRFHQRTLRIPPILEAPHHWKTISPRIHLLPFLPLNDIVNQ